MVVAATEVAGTGAGGQEVAVATVVGVRAAKVVETAAEWAEVVTVASLAGLVGVEAVALMDLVEVVMVVVAASRWGQLPTIACSAPGSMEVVE